MLKQGAALMVVSTCLFSVVGVLVKMAALRMPDEQVVFFRNFFGLAALAPLLIRGGAAGIKTREFPQHVYRALAGLAAMYCSFYAIAHMPLADALLLGYTAPLFMPILAKLWLKEPIPPGIGGILALGFAGAVVVMRPGPDLFRPVALVALATGVLAAVAQVGIRKLTHTEPTVRIVFYFGWISTLVSGVPAAAAWEMPDAKGWGLAVAIGWVATVAQLFLTRAYRLAPPAQVGPFIYTTVIFAGLLDWIFWKTLPDLFFLLGGALVVTSGVLVIKKMGAVASSQEIRVKGV
jgi:drug/metabolite transporter (DMT)-like permease